MRFRSAPLASALAILALLGIAPTNAAAQQLPLRPRPLGGLPIVPIMEGWWSNEDGTYTISFGYLNRNRQDLEIPIGERNSLEPAQFNGMQPTAFLAGRHHGVFTVTLPAGSSNPEVWWTIDTNGQKTRTPGRIVSTAYQLDYNPRPHGTVPPLLRLEEEGETGQYPAGIVASRPETVKVGELLTLAAHVEDPSVRDPNDYRFAEPPDVTVTWFKHQGPPGEIEWVRHPATPVPTPEEPADSTRAGPRPEPRGDNVITVSDGKGTALVQARFTAPGEYMLRVQADQFDSTPDSSAGNQCCWTNGYQRVRVTP